MTDSLRLALAGNPNSGKTSIFNVLTMSINSKVLSLLLSTALLLSPLQVTAADTVETWDVGATDVDFYLGYEGLGSAGRDSTVFGDLMLGYGLWSGLSAYIGTTLQGNALFSEGAGSLYLGVFGTPLDTDHLDLDLFLKFSLGGDGFSDFQVEPALELNFDLRPDQALWGLYLRTGVPMAGRQPEGELARAPAVSLVSTLGSYWTVKEGHQLLLELDAGLAVSPEPDQEALDLGGVALGYNIGLIDSLELINQIYLDISSSGRPVSVNLMTGFIVTLPSVN